MRGLVVILFPVNFLFSNCMQQNAQKNEKAFMARDTTVRPENAYTHLFLDSLQVAEFASHENDSVQNEIVSFYNARNYEFAWFDEEGLTLSAEGFWNQHDNYLTQFSDSSFFDTQLHAIMDTLLYADSSLIIDRTTVIQTELLLTKHFFAYVQNAFGTKANPKELQWYIPKRKLNLTAMLDSLLLAKAKKWQPLNAGFHRLQNSVFKYREVEKNGGWPLLKVSPIRLKKGTKNKLIKDVKERLAVERHYDPNDTTDFFTDSLFEAIKKVQGFYGQEQNGVIDAAFLNELNVTVENRIKQMLVNLERMKWMPRQPEDFIFINIPEYRFRLMKNGKEELEMEVVVGKAVNRTVIFSDELKYIVFSPYWNIPASIVRNEIVPAMRRNSSYLRRNNMEITGYRGGLPVVRQQPGRGNALGRVKFFFPNNYNIYFHDTPTKSLFDREKRAFSHGCIRLEDPFSLSIYLLSEEGSWTDAEIRKAMNRNSEKWVKLKKIWPVFITYFTSWTDEQGKVHFREDIYGHDKKLAERLFEM